MKIPFFKCDEITWKIIKLIPNSLTITDISKKGNINVSSISRLLSEIKKGNKSISIHFMIAMEKVGIISIAVLSRKYIETLPFLQSHRTVRVLGRKLHLYTGLLPGEKIIEEWLSNFEENALIVRGLERRFWSPLAPATTFEENYVCGDLESINLSERGSPKLPKVEAVMDEIDVLLYWGKYRWPFASLRKIAESSEKYLGRKIRHQNLSWHFRNHLLKLWIGNSINLYVDINEVPYRLLYLEGSDAPAVARALTQLPWFHTAYIDLDKAIVSGQPPCNSMLPLFKQLGELDVNVLDFTVEPSTMKVVPIFNLLMSITKKLEVTAE